MTTRTMATPPTAKTMRRAKIEIKAIESQYSEGRWSEVRAAIRWSFGGTRVTILEERSALATAHRLVAELLEATPPTEHWNVSTEVTSSYRDITAVRIAIELADGDEREEAAAKALLTSTVGTMARKLFAEITANIAAIWDRATIYGVEPLMLALLLGDQAAFDAADGTVMTAA